MKTAEIPDSFDTSDLDDAAYLAKCASDPFWFMQVCCRIEDKQTKRRIPFVLNGEQEVVYKAFWDAWTAKKPVRIVVLKARQMGISTLFEGLGYWMLTMQEHSKGLVLSHDRDNAEHILAITERFTMYDDRHSRGLMPELRRSNRGELVFANPSMHRRAEDPGLDSSLRVATADNRNAGHGWTGRFFHGSEVARWPKPELLAGVLNALTDAPYTLGILESTANGASGSFYETWQAAVDGKNEWIPIFLAWHKRPEYSTRGMSAAEKNKFDPTKEELALMLKPHRLTLEQLDWRRRKIASPACQGQGKTPEDVFREQFPLTPEEAFISSGKQFFDMAIVLPARKAAVEAGLSQKIGFLGCEKLAGPVRPNKLQFIEDKGGNLRIAQMPQPGADYVIGADVGAGHANGDWSVAYAMARMTGQVVAQLRTRSAYPEQLGDMLVTLAWFYNNAFLAPEGNNVGLMTARRCAANYARLMYATKTALSPWENEPDVERPGFYMESNNRKDVFLALRTALKEEQFDCPFVEFWAEAQDFIIPEDLRGKLKEWHPEARAKRHDDCVAAMAITWRVNDPYIAGAVRVAKQISPEAEGWQDRMLVEMVSGPDKRKKKDEDYDEYIGSF